MRIQAPQWSQSLRFILVMTFLTGQSAVEAATIKFDSDLKAQPVQEKRREKTIAESRVELSEPRVRSAVGSRIDLDLGLGVPARSDASSSLKLNFGYDWTYRLSSGLNFQPLLNYGGFGDGRAFGGYLQSLNLSYSVVRTSRTRLSLEVALGGGYLDQGLLVEQPSEGLFTAMVTAGLGVERRFGRRTRVGIHAGYAWFGGGATITGRSQIAAFGWPQVSVSIGTDVQR